MITLFPRYFGREAWQIAPALSGYGSCCSNGGIRPERPPARLKEAGARWDPVEKVWKVTYGSVRRDAELEERIVKV